MKKPTRVNAGQDIKAEHLNSHADAILDLQAKMNALGRIPNKVSDDGGGGSPPGPLELVSTKPPYLSSPQTANSKGIRVWLNFGTVNSRTAKEVGKYFDATTEKSYWIKATCTTTGPFAVTSWEFEEQAANFSPPNSPGARPATIYYKLGEVLKIQDRLVLANSGSGSLTVYPQIGNSLSSNNADSQIVWVRNG